MSRWSWVISGKIYRDPSKSRHNNVRLLGVLPCFSRSETMNCSHLQKPSLTSVPKQPPMICRRHQDLKTKLHLKNIKNFISTSEKKWFTPLFPRVSFSFHGRFTTSQKTPSLGARERWLPAKRSGSTWKGLYTPVKTWGKCHNDSVLFVNPGLPPPLN